MNIFRKNDTELLDKINAYELHVGNLEHQLSNQTVKIEELVNQVQELLNVKQSQDEVIEVAETLLVETEKELVDVKTELAAKEEVIQEVIDNTMTVEKQAAIKAAIILGDMGTPVVETIDSPKEVDLMQELKSLKGKELIDFYNKHKPNIYTSVKPFLKK